jgi:uncharacterized membrane protein
MSTEARSASPAQRSRALGIWGPLIVLYVALRCWRLTSYGLWADEVFSVRAARLAWANLLGFVAADAVHPPLFYVLLKLWITAGGATALWLKLLPLLVSVSALLPFWLLCRELHLSRGEAALALWLAAVNGYLIYYAQELRMYSLLFCLSLWSLWLLARFLDSERTRLGVLATLLGVNALLVYTHYFGWLLVAAEWLCVLLWRPRRLGWFSVCLVGVALSFAPWAYAVVALSPKRTVLPATLQWIQRPGWPELLWYVATLNGIIPWRHTTLLGLLLFGAPVAVAFVRGIRSQSPPWWSPFNLLCMVSFVPVAGAFMASLLLPQSVWGERYLIMVSLPYLLLVALSLSSVRPASLRALLLGLVVAWTGVASGAGLFSEEGRIPWKSLAQHMIRENGPSPGPVPVYTFEKWAAAPLEFLLADNRDFDVVVTEPRLMEGARFWVVFRQPSMWVREQPLAVLEERGCRIDAERSVQDGAQRVVVLRAAC